MSTRLYPDFIVSCYIRDYLTTKVYLTTSMTTILNVNKTIDIFKLDEIKLNPEFFTEYYQLRFNKDIGISNLFIGWDNTPWDENDYKAYLNKNGDLFVENDDFISYGLQVKTFAKIISSEKTCGENIKAICKRLLTENFYNPMILRKFGII